MCATLSNKAGEEIPVGASLFAPYSTARALYEVLLDLRGFPQCTPGVRRVEVVEAPVGPGMVSEREVSMWGIRRPRRACAGPTTAWSRAGGVRHTGAGLRRDDWVRDGATVDGARLARSLPGRDARVYLKLYLAKLGREAASDGAGVRVG